MGTCGVGYPAHAVHPACNLASRRVERLCAPASPLGGRTHAGMAQPVAPFEQDDERLPKSSEAMMYLSMTRLMLRRLVAA